VVPLAGSRLLRSLQPASGATGIPWSSGKPRVETLVIGPLLLGGLRLHLACKPLPPFSDLARLVGKLPAVAKLAGTSGEDSRMGLGAAYYA